MKVSKETIDQGDSYSGALGTRLKEVEEKGLGDLDNFPLSPLMATRTLLKREKRTLVLM